jgi:hypothetical protein
MAIASLLRVRWGAAGFTYSGWERYAYNATQRAIHAHARRFVGFDAGHYNRQMLTWHDAVRTVSWLTFLGPAFVAKLTERGGSLASTRLVQIGRAGESAVVRAGDVPERGDINRLWLPAAYVEADRLLRPVRARSCLNFGLPWTADTTADWLSRLERRVRP